jgi:gliding motility-associated lipoprotein GldH
MKKRINSNLLMFFCASILALFSSCGDAAYFEAVHNFDDTRWDKTDTAFFEIEVDETKGNYEFSLSLRTTTAFNYSNLWVYIESTAPDGTTSKVAQQLPLARPDGSWIGNVSGTVVQTEVKFAAKAFPLEGHYTFKLMNATQQAYIDHVLDIGLTIRKID